MATVEKRVPPLVAGDYLSRDEFLRSWEAMPSIKRAELIQGVVYMPSPLSRQHGTTDQDVSTWVGVYKANTPGCEGMTNATWLMGKRNAPQPEAALRILPEFGGQSRNRGKYAAGAPEFLGEVCISSVSYDLHQKLKVYEKKGVKEYLAVLMEEQEVRWHHLIDGEFHIMPLQSDGVYRSHVFPGLWLDPAALLAGNLTRVLAVLQEGLNSPEHKQLVENLAAYRNESQRRQS